jgi:L-threonylcarbamoyladenylate synthase
LRKFDELKADVVFAEAIENKGVGDAIMNRLYRAASGRLISI